MNIDSFTSGQILYDALSRSTEDYIYLCDMKTNMFYFPKEMVDEFALPGMVIKDATGIWGELIHPKERDSFYQAFKDMIDGKTNIHCQEYRALNFKKEWVWLRCRGYLEYDDEGEAMLFAGLITNIGKRGKIDPLSSLPNKFEFKNQIQFHLATKEYTGGILLLGIDNFRHINGLYGREFGDEVLHKLADTFQNLLPDIVRIYRLDGDQFALFSALDDEPSWKKIYEVINDASQSQRELFGQKYYCTLSGGCALFPKEEITSDDFYKRAEYALEHAKHEGKNQICFFHPEMMEDKLRGLAIIELMRDDVDNGFRNFELYYQPIVDAATTDVKGSEALLRWRCDRFGIVSPVEFVPLLERSGLIHTVGEWVLKNAITMCCKWRELSANFFMSINLSYLQLLRDDFVPTLKGILEQTNLEASAIKMELTESCIATSGRSLKEAFAQLRALGTKIAMDDFGTGYSTLEILKTAPADIVKIDRAFVKDILNSEFDLTFIHFVVSLCHSVHITVCLEGVETQAEYEAVAGLELDLIQGYLFGRPQPESDFRKRFLP